MKTLHNGKTGKIIKRKKSLNQSTRSSRKSMQRGKENARRVDGTIRPGKDQGKKTGRGNQKKLGRKWALGNYAAAFMSRAIDTRGGGKVGKKKG